MKHLFVTAIVVFATFQTVVAQQQSKAELVDRFSNNFCSDVFRARLDAFLLSVSNRPGSTGYVVGNADKTMPGRFSKYLLSIQDHVKFRRQDPKRFNYFRGPDSDSLEFSFWLIPDGADLPEFGIEFKYATFSQPTLFDASEIDAVKEGVVEFGSATDEPCDFGLRLDQFAFTLDSDNQLNAVLVASSNGRRERKKVLSALQITADSLVKEHGISRNRIKTIYVGAKIDSEMQLWLVPKGARFNAADFTSKIPE